MCYCDRSHYGPTCAFCCAQAPLCEEALRIKRAALGPEHPSVAQSLFNFALLLCAQGKFDAAVVDFRESHRIFSLRLGPSHQHAVMSKSAADAALRAKDVVAAVSRTRESGNELFRRRDFAGAASKYDEARTALALVLRRLPAELVGAAFDAENRKLALNLAACRMEAGQLAEAERLCDEVIRAEPKNHKALGRRGRVRQRRGNRAGAAADLSAAAEAAPSEAERAAYLAERARLEQPA